jgi:hypothetical protein
LVQKADAVIDRADRNNDEHGEDEAVEELAKRDAYLIADRVRFLTREREHVGQKGFDAAQSVRHQKLHAAFLYPGAGYRRADRRRGVRLSSVLAIGAPDGPAHLRQLDDVGGNAPRLVAGEVAS